MNRYAHGNIMKGAFNALPKNIMKALHPYKGKIGLYGNYPDIFDDPARAESDKLKIDSAWRSYCVFPDSLPGKGLHLCNLPGDAQSLWSPIVEYWFNLALESCRNKNYEDFLKYIGCLSHWLGDAFQPAHIIDLKLLEELLPPPSGMEDFHYHTDLEAVTGKCGKIEKPDFLGTEPAEVAWRTTMKSAILRRKSKNTVVPILQNIFKGHAAAAEKLSGEPVTYAARLTRDLIYTAWKTATGNASAREIEKLRKADLRVVRPEDEFHDSVYGGAIIDGNRNTPPSGAPVIPARLLVSRGNIARMKGIGMLPHSGMYAPRNCWMRFNLPAGVFEMFEAIAGMNASLVKEGAVFFIVKLDDREVFRSRRMTSADVSLKISVEIGNAASITLLVEDANDGKTFWNNHAFWGDPFLLK
ncbi:MAG: NPCBM/NEW2 domain-containing protein [Victivallales bacterium]|jgi:hypothetical protein